MEKPSWPPPSSTPSWPDCPDHGEPRGPWGHQVTARAGLQGWQGGQRGQGVSDGEWMLSGAGQGAGPHCKGGKMELGFLSVYSA